MTERKPFQFKKIKEKEYEPVHLPPAWCGAICRNAMNEVCVENCAVKRDCSGFDPKPNLNLSDMPRFPKTEGMTREEKFTSVTIYLSKVVDHLQGNENEQHHLGFPQALQTASIDKMKAIAEVAAGLEGLQETTVDAEVDITARQSTESSSSLRGSEVIPSKRDE